MMPEMGFPENRLWDEVHMQEVSGEDHWNRHLCKGGEQGRYQHEEGAAGMLAISDHPPRESCGPQQPPELSYRRLRWPGLYSPNTGQLLNVDNPGGGVTFLEGHPGGRSQRPPGMLTETRAKRGGPALQCDHLLLFSPKNTAT